MWLTMKRACLFGGMVMVTAMAVMTPHAAVYTVAKDGSGQFSSIQEAVNAAGQGDEIVINDAAVYEEQITVDATKAGLTLRSENPKSASKPTIKFLDDVNVGPTSCEEAIDTNNITYMKNGALRLLYVSNVIVEGIKIDGGEVYPFGYSAIWQEEGTSDCRWPMQHGNAAVVLYGSGNVILRDCDIANAYFGIYLIDRNEGGVFANANSGDVIPQNIVPFSAFARTGNHLIEHNRIHHNSFGLFFEAAWDMGSTIRYNLIYENHHPTSSIATKVKGLTSEGANQPGGAFNFRDVLLTPLAIYNNTFWHNLFLFVGNWNCSGNHLVFNNIFGPPFEYWNEESNFGGQSWQELSVVLGDRMHSCVYAAQQQAPTPNYVSVMNDFGNPTAEGGLIGKPFPSEANVRWLETAFLSTDEASPDFLVPDWNNALVQQCIVDKGWATAGVKDPDGTPADLGAVPSGGGRPVDVVSIQPTMPVIYSSGTVNMSFKLTPRIGTMVAPKMIFLRFINNLDSTSGFGNSAPFIATSQIHSITIPAEAVNVGSNDFMITIPDPGTFGFFELFIEGTGSDGHLFTSAAGFIPYRNIEYTLEVTVLNAEKTEILSEITAGERAVLRIAAKVNDTEFSGVIDPTDIQLMSQYDLYSPEGDTINSVPGGIEGVVDIDIVFTRVPVLNNEFVLVAGKWIDGSKVIAFLGASNPVRILPGPVETVKFVKPPEGLSAIVGKGTTYLVSVQVFDKYGNKGTTPTKIRCESMRPEIGDIIEGEIETDSTGSAIFKAVITNGEVGDTFALAATLIENGVTTETALICGEDVGVLPQRYMSDKNSDIQFELFDLQGRRIKRFVAGETFHAATGRRSVYSGTGRGMYLVRMTNVKTGKVNVLRRMKLQR